MMGFDKQKEGDTQLKVDGFNLIYEKGLEEELKEAIVDAVETPQGKGIVVRVKATSPSSCSTCAGCH